MGEGGMGEGEGGMAERAGNGAAVCLQMEAPNRCLIRDKCNHFF